MSHDRQEHGWRFERHEMATKWKMRVRLWRGLRLMGPVRGVLIASGLLLGCATTPTREIPLSDLTGKWICDPGKYSFSYEVFNVVLTNNELQLSDMPKSVDKTDLPPESWRSPFIGLTMALTAWPFYIDPNRKAMEQIWYPDARQLVVWGSEYDNNGKLVSRYEQVLHFIDGSRGTLIERPKSYKLWRPKSKLTSDKGK